MGSMRVRTEGFTLIELMLVAAIVGLLAAIALPKFGDAIWLAREAKMKGDMGAVRSALSIYYAENEGFYPNISVNFGRDFWEGLNTKYLSLKNPIIHPFYPNYKTPRFHTRNHKTESGTAYTCEGSGFSPGPPIFPYLGDSGYWEINYWPVGGAPHRHSILLRLRPSGYARKHLEYEIGGGAPFFRALSVVRSPMLFLLTINVSKIKDFFRRLN